MATDTIPPPQMSPSQSATAGERYWLYTALLSVQTVGVALILWEGVPLYRLIVKEPGPQHLDKQTIAWVTIAITVIQFSYWSEVRLVPKIKLRQNVFLSHVVLFFARISFVFGTALFSIIVFLRLPDITVSVPRLSLLIVTMFSMFCYTLELEKLDRSLGAGLKELA